jgi:hypothetical protein
MNLPSFKTVNTGAIFFGGNITSCACGFQLTSGVKTEGFIWRFPSSHGGTPSSLDGWRDEIRTFRMVFSLNLWVWFSQWNGCFIGGYPDLRNRQAKKTLETPLLEVPTMLTMAGRSYHMVKNETKTAGNHRFTKKPCGWELKSPEFRCFNPNLLVDFYLG